MVRRSRIKDAKKSEVNADELAALAGAPTTSQASNASVPTASVPTPSAPRASAPTASTPTPFAPTASVPTTSQASTAPSAAEVDVMELKKSIVEIITKHITEILANPIASADPIIRALADPVTKHIALGIAETVIDPISEDMSEVITKARKFNSYKTRKMEIGEIITRGIISRFGNDMVNAIRLYIAVYERSITNARQEVIITAIMKIMSEAIGTALSSVLVSDIINDNPA